MELSPCPACGTEPAPGAAFCDRCGSSLPTTRRSQWWLLGALALVCLAGVAVVAVLYLRSGDDLQTAAAPEPVPTTLPSPDSELPPAADVPRTTVPTTDTTPAAPSYVFPVTPPEAASYIRDHHTYPGTDIWAPCGMDYRAVTDGTVSELSRQDTWDPAVNDGASRGGLSVTLVGDDDVRYYASHLAEIEPHLEAGSRVVAGERLGAVGDTGNAAGKGCHVHFGISPPCGIGDWGVRRGMYWPWPYLDDWLAGIPTSPAAEVTMADCPS